MIDVDIRSKRQGTREILRDIRLTVEAGEVLAILGPSGVGKSTLLRLCAGIDTRFEGRISRSETLAMVFQEPVLLPWRTALENLTLTVPDLSVAGARAALERVGLGDRCEAYPRQLSLGQQRRVALARAFWCEPRVLLLDEPFASLDPDSARDMIGLTRDLIAETQPATLFVTHSDGEAAQLATRTIRLSGQPATLFPSPTSVEFVP